VAGKLSRHPGNYLAMWQPTEQLHWLEHLSVKELEDWLREVIWTQSESPLEFSNREPLVTSISSLIKQGSSALRIRIRAAVPVLVKEWGKKYDEGRCLEELLIICSTFRCAAAESAVALIVTTKLAGHANEVNLRRHCLSVLSGFGCSDQTAHLFRKHVIDFPYAATCYRALYRYDLACAAEELPRLLRTYRVAGAVPELKPILKLLFFEFLVEAQRIEVWKHFVKATKSRILRDALEQLQAINIVFEPPNRQAESQSEVKVIYDYGLKTETVDRLDVGDLGEQATEILQIITNAAQAVAMSAGQAMAATL